MNMFPDTEGMAVIETGEPTLADNEKISPVFNFDTGEFENVNGRISTCKGNEALKMWILKILKTEKGRFSVYSDTEYGVQIEDLVIGAGYSRDFVESELRREIEDALKKNSQILGISSFSYSYELDRLSVSFKVSTGKDNILSQEVIYIE